MSGACSDCGSHPCLCRAIAEDGAKAGQYQGVLEPLHTIPTRDRFGLVMVHGQQYTIADIGMRMLTPRELFRAQGFPDSYIIDPIIDGKSLTKTEQIAKCGNSVCPPVAAALVRAQFAADLRQEAVV